MGAAGYVAAGGCFRGKTLNKKFTQLKKIKYIKENSRARVGRPCSMPGNEGKAPMDEEERAGASAGAASDASLCGRRSIAQLVAVGDPLGIEAQASLQKYTERLRKHRRISRMPDFDELRELWLFALQLAKRDGVGRLVLPDGSSRMRRPPPLPYRDAGLSDIYFAYVAAVYAVRKLIEERLGITFAFEQAMDVVPLLAAATGYKDWLVMRCGNIAEEGIRVTVNLKDTVFDSVGRGIITKIDKDHMLIQIQLEELDNISEFHPESDLIERWNAGCLMAERQCTYVRPAGYFLRSTV